MNRPALQHFPQHAPAIDARVDKIIMITNNMIPLIYINEHCSYVKSNSQFRWGKGLFSGKVNNLPPKSITPINRFENNVMGIIPVNDSQIDNSNN